MDRTPGQNNHKTILIIDDNATNLRVIADYLERCGFTILVARDGESGLEKARYAQPDLILLDVMMPGMDGFETCKILKAQKATHNIPVIFMTALTDIEFKVKGFYTGGVDYVTKPFQQEEVLARVNTHLQLRELTETLEQKVQERTTELQNAYAQLSRLNKAKSKFIQVASHELRTPLSLVDGFTRLLAEEPSVTYNANAQNYIGHILHGLQRLLDVWERLLDAARVENDLVKPVGAPVNLYVLLSQVNQQFAEAVDQRKLSLCCTKAVSALPLIQADEELLRKAFYHLISNAIKYTPDGGQIKIDGRFLNTPSAPPQVEIVIADSGVGIDPEDQALIFENFYQTGEVNLHSSGQTNFKGGGSGLGLAIVKGIVLGHGGKIWAESPGHDEKRCPGSRFILRLPVSISNP